MDTRVVAHQEEVELIQHPMCAWTAGLHAVDLSSLGRTGCQCVLLAISMQHLSIPTLAGLCLCEGHLPETTRSWLGAFRSMFDGHLSPQIAAWFIYCNFVEIHAERQSFCPP